MLYGIDYKTIFETGSITKMTTKTPQSIDVNQSNYRVYSHAGEWIQGPILCPRTGNFEKVLVTL